MSKVKAEMGARLKEEIKERYHTMENLNEILGMKNIAGYTSKNPRTPSAEVMARFARAGIDVVYVLTGNREKADKSFKLSHSDLLTGVLKSPHNNTSF